MSDKLDGIAREVARNVFGDHVVDAQTIRAALDEARQEDRAEINRYQNALTQCVGDKAHMKAEIERLSQELADLVENDGGKEDEIERLRAVLELAMKRFLPGDLIENIDALMLSEHAALERAEAAEAALEAIVRHTPRQGFGQAADMRGIASAALAAAKASEEKP